MKNILFIIGAITLLFSCSLPKMNTADFEGKFIYKIQSEANIPNDSDSINYQIIYAQNEMLRIESFTPIGKQIYIKHIPKNRAYILMDLGFQKVAIQTIPDTTLDDHRYKFSFASGKRDFANITSNNIKVLDNEYDTTITMNYYKDISPKYSTAIKGIPGLPVNYFLYVEGAWINYQLIHLEQGPVNHDLFGIPSDYKKITLDEFVEMLQD